MKKITFWIMSTAILLVSLAITIVWVMRIPCEVLGSGVLRINFSEHAASIVVFHNNEPIKVNNSYLNNWFRLPQKYDEITLARINEKNVLCQGIHTEKDVRFIYLALRFLVMFIIWLMLCGLAAGELIKGHPKKAD